MLETGLRYLSRRDVERLVVSAREIADRLETLLVAERAGDAWEAPKASIAPADGRLSLALLCAARELPSCFEVSASATSRQRRSVSIVHGRAASG